MCGRFSLTLSPAELKRVANTPQFKSGNYQYRPRYNLAPTSNGVVVSESEKRGRRLKTAKWGLIPPWGGSDKSHMSTHNARVEGLDSSKLFGRLKDRRRCVVIADGFYEWEGGKKPFFIFPKVTESECVIPLQDEATQNSATFGGNFVSSSEDEDVEEIPFSESADVPPETSPMLIAGIYDVSGTKNPDEKGKVTSFSVITMSSENTEMMEAIHTRMPVFLNSETAKVWLDWKLPYKECIDNILAVAFKIGKEDLSFREVSSSVGNSKNNSKEIQLEVQKWKEIQTSKGIGKFMTAIPKNEISEKIKPRIIFQSSSSTAAPDSNTQVTNDSMEDAFDDVFENSSNTETKNLNSGKNRKKRGTPSNSQLRIEHFFRKKTCKLQEESLP